MERAVIPPHPGLLGNSQPSPEAIALGSETEAKVKRFSPGFNPGWLVLPSTVWLLLFLVRMGDLPASPDPGLYRELLKLNLLATGDCSFAIDEERNGIYLRAMRTLAALDFEEFEDLLQTIVSVAETMEERLGGLLSRAT